LNTNGKKGLQENIHLQKYKIPRMLNRAETSREYELETLEVRDSGQVI
jgi:hypothetical protein